MTAHLSWLEAAVVGGMQGVAELFPVSSLGHSVLIPAVVGGSWARDLNVSSKESPYLAFIVGLHVATAVALLIYFRRDWIRLIRGFGSSIANRRVDTADERLAWMLILATIPVGIAGLALEHTFRTVFSKPIPTALFLALNGLVLLGVERLRSRSRAAAQPVPAGAPAHSDGPVDERQTGIESDRRVARQPFGQAILIGCAEISALLPGISRSGATMAAGLTRGLSHEDAARFSFLLATPVILAAGVLKIPDLTGPLAKGIGGQVLLGSVLSFVGAYLSVSFLTRYFTVRSLRPFGIYCLVAGLACAAYLGIRG